MRWAMDIKGKEIKILSEKLDNLVKSKKRRSSLCKVGRMLVIKD